ncbi:hypothetical protein AB0H12_26550 [Actinosynnema sp. NPDC023794]
MSHLPHCVRVLHRAGMVQAHRPYRALRSLVEVRAWGPPPWSVRRAVREQPDATAVIDETGLLNTGFAEPQLADVVPLRSREVAVIAAPVFHGTGFAHLVPAMGPGSAVALAREFDESRTVESAARHRATASTLAPTTLQRILDLGPLELESHDPHGSTEVAVATVATPEDLREAPGAVGRPPRTCQVRVYDEQGRRITEPGVVGRVFAGSRLR